MSRAVPSPICPLRRYRRRFQSVNAHRLGRALSSRAAVGNVPIQRNFLLSFLGPNEFKNRDNRQYKENTRWNQQNRSSEHEDDPPKSIYPSTKIATTPRIATIERTKIDPQILLFHEGFRLSLQPVLASSNGSSFTTSFYPPPAPKPPAPLTPPKLNPQLCAVIKAARCLHPRDLPVNCSTVQLLPCSRPPSRPKLPQKSPPRK